MTKRKKMITFSIFLLFLLPFSLLFSQSEAASQIFEKNKESVVYFVSLGEGKEEISRGTGFVIGNGVMATAYHHVCMAKSVEGKNFKGKKVKVEGILAVDKNFDIALLKIKGKAPALSLGDSNELGMGKTIFALGSNEIEEIGVSDGTLEEILEYAPNRRIYNVALPVSKNFSGGPACDSSGQVLGMVIFLDSKTKFILPINILKGVQKKSSVTKFKNRPIEDYFSTFEGAYFAGRLYIALDNTGKAENYLSEVVKLKPDELEAHYLLASVYAKQRNYSSAVSSYKKIIELNPNGDSAHLGLGMVYLRMMRWKDALEPLNKAIQINLDNVEAYYHMGNAYEELKEFNKATEAYKNYLKQNPKNSEAAYNRLGVCQMELKQYEDATVSFQEALKTNSQDLEINFKLAQAYQNAGLYDDAAKKYILLAKLSPKAAIAYFGTVIRMYDEAKIPDKAVEAAQMMIEIDPNNSDAIYNLGFMYIKMEKYDEAIEAFNKVIEIRPDMEYAYIQIGFCYNKMKKYKESVAIYEKLVKVSPNNADGWYSIGINNMLQKKFSPAIDPLLKAIELRPDSGNAYYNLSICYLNLKDNYSARDVYEKLKTIDPSLAQKLKAFLK